MNVMQLLIRRVRHITTMKIHSMQYWENPERENGVEVGRWETGSTSEMPRMSSTQKATPGREDLPYPLGAAWAGRRSSRRQLLLQSGRARARIQVSS